jgi:hypothetical protein
VRSDSRCERVPVVQLLRGVALYQEIAVVERIEVNLNDVGAVVIDPHVWKVIDHL